MKQRPSYEKLERQIRALQIENDALRNAKREIEASEALHRITLENHSDSVIITDDGGKIVYTCRNVGKLLDLTRDQVYERGTIQALIGGKACDVSELKMAHEMPNMEWTITDRSGRKRFLLITAKSVSINEGTVLYSLRDITDRKETEEALLKSKQKWRNILVNIPQIAISLNPRAEIVFANEFLLNLTGWKKEEIIGKNWFDVFIPENIKEELQNIFDIIMTRKDTLEYSTYENDILTKSGERRNIAWFNVLSKDVQEDVMDVTLVGIDITERRVAQKELLRSEQRYRSMMESFADPLYICSPDLTVEYMNPAMIRRIGRNATGEKCFKTMHGFDSRCDWCIFDSVTHGDTVETTVKSPLDNRHFRVSNMPIQNPDGTISKMTIFRDITDYVKAVEEKKMAQKQLMQAQKMESIGNLAGGIAHDFNNILSSIIGFTELALDDAQKGTPLEDSLQEVFWAGKRARDLVKQILAFARQSDEKRSPLQPGIIVKEAVKFIRSTIPAAIEIRQHIDSGSLIMANATQLHQVLMNLFTNAAHAMRDAGGELDVRLKDVVVDKVEALNDIGLEPGGYVEIMVSDTGVGISPEAISRIFDPYFTTKGPGEGSGMGLAIAHGIVESYGGKITVESRLGKGTTFTLYLPATGKRTALRSHAPEALPSGTERILLVDDEAYIVNLGSKILQRLGYSVTTRTSSLEALELFRAKPNAFDLVITDMSMPNMTGDRLSIELLNIRPHLPIILCTGYSQKMSEETASEIGIKAFAYKPMVKAELAKTVRKVLDQAKS
jgi:PAS domain S-box-containing protein